MEGNMRIMGVLVGKVKEIPSVDNTLTKSGYAADAKVVGDKFEEIAQNSLGKDDVVNNLESDAIDKPLSAAMGKALKALFGSIGGSGDDTGSSGGSGDDTGSSGGGAVSNFASDITYDNSESGLDAHDVQYAITLLASMLRGKMSVDGGTFTGENLYLDNGRVRIQGNENAFWVQTLNDEHDNDNRRILRLYNSVYDPDITTALAFEDVVEGNKELHYLYGDHNKKSGAFKCPAANTQYVVDTKSWGYCVMLFGVNSDSSVVAALVCPYGAIVVSGNDLEVVYNRLRFNSGVITINHPFFMDTKNTSDYHYFVL